jgi:hypothetical protein
LGSGGTDGDQAAVALGQSGTLPSIAGQYLAGQFDQWRRAVAAQPLGACPLGRGCPHGAMLAVADLSPPQRGLPGHAMRFSENEILPIR